MVIKKGCSVCSVSSELELGAVVIGTENNDAVAPYSDGNVLIFWY